MIVKQQQADRCVNIIEDEDDRQVSAIVGLYTGHELGVDKSEAPIALRYIFRIDLMQGRAKNWYPEAGNLELVPTEDAEGQDGKRTIIYLSGASGEGKTHYAMKYARRYRHYYPDREIILISPIHDSWEIKPLNIQVISTSNRNIQVARELFVDEENKLTSEDFNNCLIIFDDIESSINPKVKKGVHALKDEILTQGRHNNISCVVCSHIIRAGDESRNVLREAQFLVLFPRDNSGNLPTYLTSAIRDHCGRHSLDAIKSLIHSRMVRRALTIHMRNPAFVMGEHGLMLI